MPAGAPVTVSSTAPQKQLPRYVLSLMLCLTGSFAAKVHPHRRRAIVAALVIIDADARARSNRSCLECEREDRRFGLGDEFDSRPHSTLTMKRTPPNVTLTVNGSGCTAGGR